MASVHFLRRFFCVFSCFFLCMTSVAAFAVTKACPPLGSLPNYLPDDQGATLYDYKPFDFEVGTSDSSQTVTVAGSFCELTYGVKDGVEPMSDLEVISNYRSQLSQLGAQVTYSGDTTLEAKLVKGGQETWMKIASDVPWVHVDVVRKHPLKFVLTAPSGSDYRLLGHMPNYEAGTPTKRNFDQLEFDVSDGNGGSNSVKVQGARYEIGYTVRDNAQMANPLESLENYRQALTKLGAQILYQGNNDLDARLEQNGQSIWVKIYAEDADMNVAVIEEKPFKATIQPANDMKAALDKEGKVALYVNFDFNKASLRPDAAPVIAQVVALMKQYPSLKLVVQGNTDNVGVASYNQTLSSERAASVVAALVKDGVAANRLSSSGNGADKPIASNDTAEGRAKNRRVELVKQ